MSSKEIYLTPAEVVIRSFGGVNKTAVALGIHKTSVSEWTNPKTKKNVGLVPTGIQRKVLELAHSMGIKLTPKDIILGRRIVLGGDNG